MVLGAEVAAAVTAEECEPAMVPLTVAAAVVEVVVVAALV